MRVESSYDRYTHFFFLLDLVHEMFVSFFNEHFSARFVHYTNKNRQFSLWQHFCFCKKKHLCLSLDITNVVETVSNCCWVPRNGNADMVIDQSIDWYLLFFFIFDNCNTLLTVSIHSKYLFIASFFVCLCVCVCVYHVV